MINLENIYAILKENGWYPDRKIDTKLILQNWNDHNYTASKEQIQFVESFGDLTIKFRNCNNIHYWIELFPADWDFVPEILKDYENYFETSLIPIGEICCQDATLLMDKDLKIYGVFGEEVTVFGNSFFNFIENLYSGKKIYWYTIEGFYD